MIVSLPEEILGYPAVTGVGSLQVEVVVNLGHSVVDGSDGAAGLRVGGEARGTGRPQRDGGRLHRGEVVVFVTCKPKQCKHVSADSQRLLFGFNSSVYLPLVF